MIACIELPLILYTFCSVVLLIEAAGWWVQRAVSLGIPSFRYKPP